MPQDYTIIRHIYIEYEETYIVHAENESEAKLKVSNPPANGLRPVKVKELGEVGAPIIGTVPRED
jgi:hypothetical protein